MVEIPDASSLHVPTEPVRVTEEQFETGYPEFWEAYVAGRADPLE